MERAAILAAADIASSRPDAEYGKGAVRRTEVMRSVGIRCRESCIEASLVVVAAAWLLLAVVASLRGGDTPPGGPLVELSYLAFAPVLLVGVTLGRLAARRWLDPLVLILLVLLALMLLFGIPGYANAQAAGGVQLVAAAVMMLAGESGSREMRAVGRPKPRTEPVALPSHRVLKHNDLAPAVRNLSLTRVLGVLVGVLGLALAARSKAGVVLVLLVLVLAVIVVRGRPRVTRATLLGVGIGAVGLAALSVILLGSIDEWPEPLTRAESLSSARHGLWAEAIALWREHPLVGGGPGSFYASSSLAGSDSLLYAAHSSILQVVAELGLIGAFLLVALLVTGAALAAQGGRSRTLIGVGAWCALAVHSMIDHLYEFPIVVLLAGVVIGWSGARRRAGPLARSEAANAPRHDLA